MNCPTCLGFFLLFNRKLTSHFYAINGKKLGNLGNLLLSDGQGRSCEIKVDVKADVKASGLENFKAGVKAGERLSGLGAHNVMLVPHLIHRRRLNRWG